MILKYRNNCLITMLLTLGMSCSEDLPENSVERQLNVYDFNVQSAAYTSGTYLINCLNEIICLSETSEIRWQYGVEDLFSAKENDALVISEFLPDPGSDGYYVFASAKNSREHYVKLIVVKIANNAEILWQKEILITDKYEDKAPRANEEFYLRENNYPISAVAEDYIFTAFSYDEQAGVRAKYMLLELDKSGDVIRQRSFDMGDFYGRIYKVLISSASDFVISRGGRDWFILEKFDRDFISQAQNRISSVEDGKGKVYEKIGDPILNNIIEPTPGEFLFTGHIDLLNNVNTNFITNFDYFVARWKENEISYSISGLNEYKELSFNSFFGHDQKIKLVGVKRGLNELVHDVDSDLVLVNVSEEGKISDSKIIIENQGTEAVFGKGSVANQFEFIGNKTGFTNKDFRGFYLKYQP